MKHEIVSQSRGRHAVVVGGSIAGCLFAETLARIFDRVTILEKENFSEDGLPRRTIPQENHVHLLLLRGKQIIEDIFPGILKELEEAGAIVADLGHDVKCYQYGRWKERFPTGIYAHYCSRRLIDSVILNRVKTNPKIRICWETSVIGLELDIIDGSSFIKGVRTEDVCIEADIVVDASGRGSKMPKWLRQANLPEPRRTLVETRLGYVSRIYRSRQEYSNKWKVLLVLPKPPVQRCMGVISPIEHNRWMVTVSGWFGAFPKPNVEDYERFLKTLPVSDISNVICDAEPLSDVYGFTFPGSQRTHYDEMATLPDGLLVLGDALCSVNPIYSHGMTLCALQAKVLEENIQDWLGNRISTRYIQKIAAEAVGGAWEMAVSEDLRFPDTQGKRTWALKARHWYGAQLVRQSARHRVTQKTIIGVTNLVVPPDALFNTQIIGAAIIDNVMSILGQHPGEAV